MSIRIFAIALLATVISSPVIAQGGGGGAGGSSSAGGGGAAPGGTAGVSPSTSSPAIGTPGIPGPTSGAGLPGGPGPGNTAAAPNPPAASPSSPAVTPAGSDTGAGSTKSTNSGLGGGSPANGKASANAKSPAIAKWMETQGTSAAASEFHPEAVIDQSLGQASADINAMSSAELRQLVTMFDLCTANQHPTDREGKCAAASKRYSSAFGKNRAVDRALAELERVVRFQSMFRTATAPSTEYEDNINNRLRGAARIALAATDQTAQVSLKRQGARR